MIYSWMEIRYILNFSEFKFEEVYFRAYKKGNWRIKNRKNVESGRMKSGKERNKFFVYFME